MEYQEGEIKEDFNQEDKKGGVVDLSKIGKSQKIRLKNSLYLATIVLALKQKKRAYIKL